TGVQTCALPISQAGARTPTATAVQACVNAKSRAVTVPASGSGCPAGTTAIIWNVPGPAGPGTSSDLEPVFSGPRYHFDDPEALATDGAHVFVANAGNNSVTEVDASNGSLVRVLSDPGYGFSNPSAMAFDGTHLWVANADGNSVTEINASDGSLARIVEDPSYAFSQPSALLTEGGQLWVANRRGNSVTEINTNDASLVRTVQGPSYAFEGPGALAFDGSDIWVANGSGNTVTELSATDGTLIRNVSDGIENPQSLAYDGRHLWVGDGGFSSDIAEINASDGTSAGESFGCARKMIFDGSHLLASCTAVFELDLSSGDLKWAPGDSGDLGDSE